MWLFKMLSTMGAIAVFFYAYFWVMRHPLSTVTTMPEIGIDELISFQPQSFFLYVSLWVYVTFGTALARDLRELAAYGAASLVMAVIRSEERRVGKECREQTLQKPSKM